ncbi:uncharacterized protein MONBRDRAFT_31870 [Monosiga brevicollis MX1]|uniref:B30.2/SPRY domain-containing protein n=1 Tax=Monosiga brevicollis TaxID=81824 RepID=A9UVX3_MONBE|nr:uncharacterized protein MONBRDRAFT_31870 [Monosiga brevicollis MX1]EDQ90664.1 predicted protein [Monosiga brevicollis MX1]|eukprot:XP_001744715.1 hypothetical protein [Monosiga brevicollis MX1]
MANSSPWATPLLWLASVATGSALTVVLSSVLAKQLGRTAHRLRQLDIRGIEQLNPSALAELAASTGHSAKSAREALLLLATKPGQIESMVERVLWLARQLATNPLERAYGDGDDEEELEPRELELLQTIMVLEDLSQHVPAAKIMSDLGLIQLLAQHLPSWATKLQQHGLILLSVLAAIAEDGATQLAQNEAFRKWLVADLSARLGGRLIVFWQTVLYHLIVTNHAELTSRQDLVLLRELSLVFYGQTELHRQVLHALLRVATNGDPADNTARLDSITTPHHLRMLVGSLRSDDHDQAYWALGIIYEMTSHGVAIAQLQRMPKIMQAFLNVLNAFEATIQRVILRAIGSLALRNSDFKWRILHSGLGFRICECLTSGDEDLANWAVVVAHDLTMLGKDACHQLVEHGRLIRALEELIQKQNEQTSRLAAETLGFVCSHRSLHRDLIRQGIIKPIHRLLESEDEEQVFWATAMMLSLVSTLACKSALADNSTADLLMPWATKDEVHQITVMAVRVLTSLAFHQRNIAFRVAHELCPVVLQRLISQPEPDADDIHLLAVLCRSGGSRRQVFHTPHAMDHLLAAIWRYCTFDPERLVAEPESATAGGSLLRVLHQLAADARLAPSLKAHGLYQLLGVLLCGLVRRNLVLRRDLRAMRGSVPSAGHVPASSIGSFADEDDDLSEISGVEHVDSEDDVASLPGDDFGLPRRNNFEVKPRGSTTVVDLDNWGPDLGPHLPHSPHSPSPSAAQDEGPGLFVSPAERMSLLQLGQTTANELPTRSVEQRPRRLSRLRGNGEQQSDHASPEPLSMSSSPQPPPAPLEETSATSIEGFVVADQLQAPNSSTPKRSRPLRSSGPVANDPSYLEDEPGVPTTPLLTRRQPWLQSEHDSSLDNFTLNIAPIPARRPVVNPGVHRFPLMQSDPAPTPPRTARSASAGDIQLEAPVPRAPLHRETRSPRTLPEPAPARGARSSDSGELGSVFDDTPESGRLLNVASAPVPILNSASAPATAGLTPPERTDPVLGDPLVSPLLARRSSMSLQAAMPTHAAAEAVVDAEAGVLPASDRERTSQSAEVPPVAALLEQDDALSQRHRQPSASSSEAVRSVDDQSVRSLASSLSANQNEVASDAARSDAHHPSGSELEQAQPSSRTASTQSSTFRLSRTAPSPLEPISGGDNWPAMVEDEDREIEEPEEDDDPNGPQDFEFEQDDDDNDDGLFEASSDTGVAGISTANGSHFVLPDVHLPRRPSRMSDVSVANSDTTQPDTESPEESDGERGRVFHQRLNATRPMTRLRSVTFAHNVDERVLSPLVENSDHDSSRGRLSAPSTPQSYAQHRSRSAPSLRRSAPSTPAAETAEQVFALASQGTHNDLMHAMVSAAQDSGRPARRSADDTSAIRRPPPQLRPRAYTTGADSSHRIFTFDNASRRDLDDGLEAFSPARSLLESQASFSALATERPVPRAVSNGRMASQESLTTAEPLDQSDGLLRLRLDATAAAQSRLGYAGRLNNREATLSFQEMAEDDQELSPLTAHADNLEASQLELEQLEHSIVSTMNRSLEPNMTVEASICQDTTDKNGSILGLFQESDDAQEIQSHLDAMQRAMLYGDIMTSYLDILVVSLASLYHHDDELKDETRLSDEIHGTASLLWMALLAVPSPSTAFNVATCLNLHAREVYKLMLNRRTSARGTPKRGSVAHRGSQSSTLAAFIPYLSSNMSTSHLLWDHGTLTARNDFWTYETAVLDGAAHSSGIWAFGVRLESSSVTQIGWCTSGARFHARDACGVGDTRDSYSFDGERLRIWHDGREQLIGGNLSYGRAWSAGDVVVAILDLDAGTMAFQVNNEYLGIAIRGINKYKRWHPCASLATGEEAHFLFEHAWFPKEARPWDQALNLAPRPPQLEERVPLTLREMPLLVAPVTLSAADLVMYFEATHVAGETVSWLGYADDVGDACGVTVDWSRGLVQCGPTILWSRDGIGLPAHVCQSSQKALEVVGIGLTTSCQVMLTVNGHALDECIEAVPDALLERYSPTRMLWPASSTSLCLNFGQSSFAYGAAEAAAIRAVMIKRLLGQGVRLLRDPTAES